MLKIRRILIPIDFSEHCTRALTHARELASAHGSDMDLIHVIEESAFPAFYKVGEEAMYGEVSSLRERAQAALVECMGDMEEAEFEGGMTFHVEQGKPDEKIIEVADETDTDLIVISTHGMSGLERVLMGSVAEKVIRDAPCPVFVVKSFGKSLVPAD